MRIILKREEKARELERNNLINLLNQQKDKIEKQEKTIKQRDLAIKELTILKQEDKELYQSNINRLEEQKESLEGQIKGYLEHIKELKGLNRELSGQKGGYTKKINKLNEEIEDLKGRIENQAYLLKKDRIQPTPKEYGERLKTRKNEK